jgi:hypothetical protein
LIVEANAEVERIEAAESDTPNEYICTADLYETTEKNAAATQKAWPAFKNRKS